MLIPRLPKAEALLPFLCRIDDAHWYSNYGPLWREFTDGLSQFVGSRCGQDNVGVAFASSGTTAIELALRTRALPGARFCFMPSFTFIASAHAVCNAGLTPYLLDVDERTLVLTPEIAAAALRNVPEQPAAILVISAFGAPPDVLRWEQFEQEFGVPVVFDAAAALTSLDRVGYQPLCVSLHATKVFGIGEGGAILSSDARLTEHLTAMTGFGFSGASRVSGVRGGNYRISEYAAAVGLAALAGIDAKIATLAGLVNVYRKVLHGKPARMQDGVGERWVTMTLNVVLDHTALTATLDNFDRDRVEWRRWWGLGCHRHPAFADLPRTALEVTDDLAPRVIGIPFHQELTTEQIERVAACIGRAAQ